MESWNIKKFKEATEPSLDDFGDVGDFEQPEDRYAKVSQKIRDMAEAGRRLYVTNLQLVSESLKHDDQATLEDLIRDEALSADDMIVIRELVLVHAFGFLESAHVIEGDYNSYEASSAEGFKYIHLFIISGDRDPQALLFDDPEFLKLVDFNG